MQISSSNLLQVGDQNRNYKVQIGCISIENSKEYDALNWLKHELPRKKRVNLRPLSSEDGILIARVIPFGDDRDLSFQMIQQGFGSGSCGD